ncbi:MAG: 1-acyl-sn-glycerol-3-phosphate acyltransferase [Tannerellaceae bacterium]
MAKEGITQIDLKQVLRQKAPSVAGKIPDFVVNYLIRTVHQEELNDILARYHDKQGVDFMQALIGYFDLTLEMVNEENIPSEGRYIFASNHPLGGLDGICLSAIVGGRFGGNIRYLVNDLLLYLPNLRSIFVPINKHGAQGKQNAELIENAYASDNQIITFPAGLCSRKIDGRIQDPEWKKSFIQKAVEYKRDIVPVYFNGRNSNFFYRLTNLRKALGIKMNYEMIYLPDEMFRCKHKTFRICFGTPIPWQTFDHSRKPTEWAEWVRQCVYKLKDK